ncbi:hypothetical protein PCANC_05600 [Puccinia coronata f. sp. avenae]|uniref:Integrase catalytic domain-containing protein n=1 Tax=Puccinia coronata f. sp. avenae TaxID=200324 RepID=A0A2N5VK07_9BASI|nr:hypothetical protein PCANC_19328 [Puccinia coronata f. sp. avenae]PLW50331.1 hypothetical protein PCASD_01718 [Puccinia coronata f. sp. avenae]PLW54502.1 hypothetical protein PCANC_05600 [Puccinia coronata f. sp. avenae]
MNWTAIIHTDRGGESSSKNFLSKLHQLGIRIEAGSANSPQTNGLDKRFNQTLLMKIRCLLAQSSVPINYWDEAAQYASTLINILPSKSLNWSSPVNVLSELNLCIEPIRDINKLIPFGLKVHVSHRPPSIISAPSKPLICLGYKDHSDALRFFDSTQRHIFISRDYTPSKLSFPYNSPTLLIKPPETLPKAGFLTPNQDPYPSRYPAGAIGLMMAVTAAIGLTSGLTDGYSGGLRGWLLKHPPTSMATQTNG